MAVTGQPREATLYRMVMPGHLCPWGLKSKDLLERKGFRVEDRWLTSREQIEAFKTEHGVKTTPQTFVAGERSGGGNLALGFVSLTENLMMIAMALWMLFGSAGSHTH